MFTWFLASSAFCLFEGATRLRKTRSGFRGLVAALGLFNRKRRRGQWSNATEKNAKRFSRSRGCSRSA